MKKGWETKKLDDVSLIKGRIGYRGYTKNDLVNKGEGAISLSPSNIRDNKLFFENCTYISWKKYNESPEIMIYEGDIIFCKTASIGKMALVEYLPEKATLNPQFVVLKDISCSNKYLYYFMVSEDFKKQVSNIIGGTAVPTLSQKNLGNLKLPLPPLPEQKRIVAILDEAFSAIDKAKVNAEQNLKNAKELFESYLQGVFENGNWEEKTLGEVCEFTQGIQRDVKLQSENKKDNQVRFLRIVDFTQGNEPPRYIDNPGEKYILNSNDVSLVRYGASTGFVCRGLEGALANNLFRVIPKSNKVITNEFLFVYLTAPVFQNVIKESMNGAAMPAISFGLIKDIPFPIISIEAQQTIVQKLDALSAETKKLEAIYLQKINDLDELKKSILQKAFSGELNTENIIA